MPLAGAVWAYDLRAKNTAAGPAGMAACRGLDVLLGASARAARAGRCRPALTVAAHTYTVTALSRREVSGADPALPAATLAGTAAVAAAAAGRPARRRAAGRRRCWPPGTPPRYGARPGAGWPPTRRRGRVRAAVGAGITAPAAAAGRADRPRRARPAPAWPSPPPRRSPGALARKVSPT